MIYLVVSAFSLALLLVAYRLTLSRTTFHGFNRVVLLCSLALAAVVPFMHFQSVGEKAAAPITYMLNEIMVYADGSIRDLAEYCGTLRPNWSKAWVQSSAYSLNAQLPYPHRRRSPEIPRFAVSWTPDRDCRIVRVEWIHHGPSHHSNPRRQL